MNRIQNIKMIKEIKNNNDMLFIAVTANAMTRSREYFPSEGM